MPAQAWVTLGSAVLAVTGVLLGLWQKGRADRRALGQKTLADSRAEWWRRAQFAVDKVLSSDELTQAAGFAIIRVLMRSELAGEEETRMLQEISEHVVDLDARPIDNDEGKQGQ